MVGGAMAAGLVNVAVQLEAASNDPSHKFDWLELLLCCAAGAGAACLPDLLEPADSPNHRKFCHSLAAASLVGWTISGKHIDELSPEARTLLLAAGVGYLSHLALDGATPKCIPFC
jgi:membrane-bound metal-dependent hydrolase YbcI (DUF457 family)